LESSGPAPSVNKPEIKMVAHLILPAEHFMSVIMECLVMILGAHSILIGLVGELLFVTIVMKYQEALMAIIQDITTKNTKQTLPPDLQLLELGIGRCKWITVEP
jgi:hypothetical protein